MEMPPGMVATPEVTIPIATTADTILTVTKPSITTNSIGTSSIVPKSTTTNSTAVKSIAAVSRTSIAITFQTRTPGHTTTTGPDDRPLSAVLVATPVDLAADSAAGLQERTAFAVGEVCAPADSVVSTVSAASAADDDSS